MNDSFWSQVDKTPGCWLWTGPLAEGGYGRTLTPDRTRAHRMAWEEAHGPVPDDLCVLHHCDTRLCVRPSLSVR